MIHVPENSIINVLQKSGLAVIEIWYQFHLVLVSIIN